MSKKSTRKTNPGWFRKGRSGNPGGRPAGSGVAEASPFEVLVDTTVTVTGPDGIIREITTKEALQLRIYQDALAGKPKAFRQVLKWMQKRDAWLAKRRPVRVVSASHKSPDPGNADAALLLLGIAGPNPARAHIDADRMPLLLELWAAQAALRRRRGGNRLTDTERDEIRRCTRDPDRLRWPRGTGE